MQPMASMALRAARKAGNLIERAFEDVDQLHVKTKSPSDFVTEIDKAAEDEIVAVLQKAYPDHAFITEESAAIGDPDTAEYTWIIDPLDGTTNFIRGIPHFAVSIACMKGNKVEHAAIYDPIKREEYVASRGAGAQLNGRRIRVKPTFDHEKALYGTGIPFGQAGIERMQQFQAIQEKLALGSAGIRRAGAASLDLAYVAAGRLDAFWEDVLQPWDKAAGALLVLEAGGLVSDFTGGNNYLKPGNIVAGSPKAFKQTLQAIQPTLT
ncbi:MAG: inositol monophosphatase family protein [Cellvibrionales bacterium]|nr:inositol monophosphatase family protein [Cellvibrionales bacterium]